MEGSSSFRDLSEDVVVEEILSRLPIEHLIKCRYVSKLWKNRFIPQVLLSQRKPKPTTFGLIVWHSTMEITHGTPDKLSLHRRIEEDEQRSVGGRGGEYIQVIPNLCLHESQLWSSCNGLLLCTIKQAAVKPMTIYFYYVCNPVLNQWVALPQPNNSLRRLPNIGFAAYDTTSTIDDHIQGHHQEAAAQHHHYKVVHFYFEKTYLLETKMIPCEMFSSETGEWRHHQARLLSTSSVYRDITSRVLEINDWLSTYAIPHLYHKGVIYWKLDWYNYLLLFLLEDKVFKLIPLPDDPNYGFVYHNRIGPSLLWESKGCIYYLWATISQLRVWAYPGSSTKEDEEWVLKHVVERQILIPQMPPESILSIGMNRLQIFDANLQVLHLPMSGEIFSYNFETEKLTALRMYKYENNAGGDKGDLVPLTGLGNVIPYRFTLFDLPTWDGCKVLRPKLSADKTCLLTRSLFNLPTRRS